MSILLAASAALAASVSTGALDATLEADQLTALQTAGGAAWLSAPSAVYDLGGAPLTPTLDAEPLPDGQLLLRLRLDNPGPEAVQADLVFPHLSGLGTDAAADLGYLFPALGPILDDEATTHRRHYGALFPLQFMEIHQGEAGLWLMTRDLSARAKTYRLAKDGSGQASLAVEWPDLVVPAGDSLTLEAALGVHDSDWHEALGAYRRWVRTWYQPRAQPKAEFREAFNLRQLHLHPNDVLGEHPGAFDSETGAYAIQQYLAEDAEAMGGVDWVHIFDWGMDWVHGRVGDYNPWSYLGAPADLQSEVDALQAQGVGVGLYVEGYLLDTPSLVGTTWGDDWELHDSAGQAYTNYAPSWHTCPGVDDWRAHFALRNGRRTELRVGASGLYIDQHGYGYQYPCHRSDHDHTTAAEQIRNELDFMAQLRTAMSPQQVLYTEAAPVDVAAPWQDGAFTEAITAYRADARTVPITIRRFALPLSKTFELLTQDAPLADDIEGVRLAFFNGEGIRHMGYLEADPWFDTATLAEISQAWTALRTWRHAFTTLDPVPLVQTAQPGVRANLFPAGEDRVWTLLNHSDQAVTGTVLSIDTVPGASWWDCWNDRELVLETADGFAQIDLSLGPGAVGCVVETRPAATPALIAHWALDETSGDQAADSAGTATATHWPTGGPLTGVAAPSSLHGTAYEFDGASALSLGVVPALSDLGADFSMAAWVWPDTSEGVQRILAVDGWNDGGLVFGLTEVGQRRALVLTTVGVQDHVLPVVVPTDRWTHVAVVVDAGASAHFYVNGELRGSVANHVPALSTESAWWMGSNGTDGFWSGGLDDVRVYKGALDQAELRALADIAPPMPGWITVPEQPWTHTDRLTLWWPGFFDPGSGIAEYAISLGTSQGADDLYAAVVPGDAQHIDLEGLDLPDGTLHLGVRATDGLGRQTTVHHTAEIDAALPEPLAVWTFDRDTPLAAPVAVDGALERSDPFSITAWINPAAAGPMTIFGSDAGGWSLSLGGDGDDLVFATTDLETHAVSTSLPTDAWTHVAAVFDRNSDATLYVGGVPVGVGLGTIPPHPSTSGFFVGGQATPWQGGLDDVRLYDRALGPDHVWAVAFDQPEDTGAPPDTHPPSDSDGPIDTAGGGPAHNPGDEEGCGCAAQPSGGALWLLLGWVPLIRRRG